MNKLKGMGLLVLAGALIIAGCAKAPVEEKKAAQQAMDNAVAAQAESYAANSLNEAKNLWNDAEAKLQKKAFAEAKTAYIAAKAAFEKAAGEVDAGKKAIADENKTVLAALETSSKELAGLASKKAKKLQADMKTAWASESKKIEEAVKSAKDNVLSPAEIKAKLAEAKSLIEKWLENFKK